MKIDRILENLEKIHVLILRSDIACSITEDEMIAFIEVKEILKNQETEKERIIGKLIDAYDKAYIKSKTIDTPRETLIRWDGHKEGISEASDIVNDIVKRGK